MGKKGWGLISDFHWWASGSLSKCRHIQAVLAPAFLDVSSCQHSCNEVDECFEIMSLRICKKYVYRSLFCCCEQLVMCCLVSQCQLTKATILYYYKKQEFLSICRTPDHRCHYQAGLDGRRNWCSRCAGEPASSTASRCESVLCLTYV